MNLHSKFAWVRVAGLVSVLGLVACDSGSGDQDGREEGGAGEGGRAGEDASR
jgi:hypothetical protein